VVALAKVVSAGVNDNGTLSTHQYNSSYPWSFRTYANDALWANELDQLVLDSALSISRCVGLEVAQVTNVAFGILGGAVGLAVRVDCGGSISYNWSTSTSRAMTYSEVQQRCSRWCCHRTGGRACLAQRWRRGR
jgi:hypothetical protein